MHVCLIVTTYNWPDALDLTLATVARQTRAPAEVIVADDGSGSSTRAVIDRWRARGLDLQHVWQQDRGFRLARSRNRAIAATSADYIVLVDGDVLLHPRFLEDHVACAHPERFIQGARPQLSSAVTARCLERRETRVGFWTRGIRRRAYALRSPLLSALASRTKAALGGIQGCNQSFWRHHALEVNGYDERFTGWGPEDREFAARLVHIGVNRLYLRHRAIAFHLDHPTRAPATPNPFEHLLNETLARRVLRTAYGIDTHRSSSDELEHPAPVLDQVAQ